MLTTPALREMRLAVNIRNVNVKQLTKTTKLIYYRILKENMPKNMTYHCKQFVYCMNHKTIMNIVFKYSAVKYLN